MADPRAAAAARHPDVFFVDPRDLVSLGDYLLAQGLASAGELPCRAEPAGAGNMNLTLRVSLRGRSLILKQGRPWVEKYDHIPAPFERSLVEGAFYRAAGQVPAVTGRMPRLVHLDERNRVLVLDDLGSAGDATSLYAGQRLAGSDLEDLLAWLAALREVKPVAADEARFANRAMRALNHEHIFRFPLDPGNGLALDGITPGLAEAAAGLQRDQAYRSRTAELGERYLADGDCLVHGDYFPGSWVRTAQGLRVIDPEFCFRGAREFDYGVLLAHFALAGSDVGPAERVLAAGRQEGLDEPLLLGFAGAEIMRRLIGVAQLPLRCGLDEKRRLLEVSRRLVLAPSERLGCWT